MSDRTTQAKGAFAAGNVEDSKKAHLLKATAHTEENNDEGKFLKPIVFGGLDGVSTIFAFLAGAVGAQIALVHIVALGFAQLFAGALGMGMGEYFSSKAEQDVARREEAREMWEVENNPEGEVQEMCDIYEEKGLSKEDALTVARTLSKYPDFWVEHMMLHEIGMFPPEDEGWQTVLQGVVMFSSFMILGGLPLFAYIIAGNWVTSAEGRFQVTCLAAVSALFLLGVVKAHTAGMSLVKEGISMVCQGCICAGGAYLIGNTLPAFLHLD